MLRKAHWALVGLVILGAGCKGGAANKSTSGSTDAANTQNASPPAAPSQASIEFRTLGERVVPNGHVVDVQMIADAKGARFEPSTVMAHRGDVVDFKIVSGVHNVHFPVEKNPGVHVPPATEQLQLPGQTYDLVVGAKPGSYHFQCDPHAALGMVGTLVVQ